MTEPNITYLWDNFQRGDEASFNTMYNLYYEKLYQYANRITQNRELIKDVIHDLFVKLWCNKENFSSPQNILAYLLQALRNTLYNKMEQEGRLKDVGKQRAAQHSTAHAEEFHSKKLEDEDMFRRLKIIFDKLTPRQKEFMHLYYLEDLSYEDVAAVLGLSIKATYKLAARSIASVKQGLTTAQQARLLANMKLFLLFC